MSVAIRWVWAMHSGGDADWLLGWDDGAPQDYVARLADVPPSAVRGPFRGDTWTRGQRVADALRALRVEGCICWGRQVQPPDLDEVVHAMANRAL